MDTAVKIKIGMLEEHISRPREYGYNQMLTQYFETEGEFFEAWSETSPCGLPRPSEDETNFKIHKRFGTVYVDDEGTPVACVSVDECPAEEMQKNTKR